MKGLRAALVAGCALTAAGACSSGGSNAPASATCASTRTFFEQQVWSAFMGQVCTKCHTPDGVAPAAGSKLVLQPSSYPGFIDANLATLTMISNIEYQGTSELLLKPIGLDGHVGGVQISPTGPELAALKELVTRLNTPDTCVETPNTTIQKLQVLDGSTALRKASLDLAGRLPTEAETRAVSAGGDAALDTALDGFMKEDAFYDRLREIWNDSLLTDRFLEYGGAALDALDDKDYPGIDPLKDPTNPKYVDHAAANTAIAREPLHLIAYVVKNERPFSEVLTASYALVNPFSAAAYGVTGHVKFSNPRDPNEFHEAQVVYPNGTRVPHAGVLSTPAFLNRWQTTPTNVDRGRARRVFSFFLATDVLKIALRPVDPTKVTEMDDPTRNSPYCTVCHTIIDPLAGGFRGYDDYNYAHFDPTLPWHDNMFPPGFDGTDLPSSAYGNALPWTAAQLVTDPRFVISAVRTMYQGLTGHTPIAYPDDPTVATFVDDLAAWSTQDDFFRATATAFQGANLNLKVVVKAIVKSPYYRGASVPSGLTASPSILRDVGTARLLTPEMLNRKIVATTGIHWRKNYDWANQHDWLLEDYDLLYGGIDSDAVTTRLTAPNGMGAAVGARMANEVACAVTAFDFSKPRATRTLFPKVDVMEVPESAGNTVDGSVTDIKANIQALHALLLGETLDVNDPEITRTYQVFLDTWHELQGVGKPDLDWQCQAQSDPTTGVALPKAQMITQDGSYALRSWMAVVSYLLSDYKFLYE